MFVREAPRVILKYLIFSKPVCSLLTAGNIPVDSSRSVNNTNIRVLNTDVDINGCLSRLTYSLPARGHAISQEDTGLPQYVGDEDTVLCHGNNGLLIRPQIPCLAQLLTGQHPSEPPLSVLEHLQRGAETVLES